MFNHVAPYGYLLPDMYLFIADIADPDSLVRCCRTCICLNITLFYEDQRQASSGFASGSHYWGREVSTQFSQQFVSAVTAPLHVDCVDWSLNDEVIMAVKEVS